MSSKTLAVAGLGLIAFAVWSVHAYRYTLDMPGASHSGPLPHLTDQQRTAATTLRDYVEAVASEPHNTMHPAALERSARVIETRLASFGYEPVAQRYTADGVEVRNIEVVIEPRNGSKDAETIVVGAHYDSFGLAPGANDNGSGTAALLFIARELRTFAPGKRIRLVFFVNEEPPHFMEETMGSLVYARALAASGERVVAMLSLETIGSYSDEPRSQRYPPLLNLALPDVANFVAVTGTLDARALAADVLRRFRESTAFPSEGGVAPGWVPGIAWSDHWSFSSFGIPAVMITDTALFRYDHYHLPSDTPDKLDYERLARVTGGMLTVIRGIAE